jgi:hypothetical protein
MYNKEGKVITYLIDDKSEEEKVNVYEIKFKSIYRKTNSKEIALSLLFFILMLTAYKREEKGLHHDHINQTLSL